MWKKVTLKEISEEVKYGYTESASKDKIGPKFLRITDIASERIEWDTVPYCKINEAEINKYRLREGDIVIARTGATTGYAKRIKYESPLSIFASYLVRFRIKPSVDNRYIGALIESDIYKQYIKSIVGGAAQPNANAQSLGSFEFNLPELPTQQKIASILSAYDDLIENNTRRIKILEEIAQTIYKEWFVNFRFPGHEKVKFVDLPAGKAGSSLGKIPEGWEVVELNTFGYIITGKTPSTKIDAYFGDEIPFIKTPDMHSNIFIIKTNQYLSKEGADSQEKKYLPPNSICISCIGTVGVVSITSELSQTNQQINSIILNNQNNLEYLYFTCVSLKETLVAYGINGATMANVNKEKFSAMKVLKPKQNFLDEYQKTVNQMFEEIKNLLFKNQNLRKTRNLLLPKLMSGEVEI